MAEVVLASVMLANPVRLGSFITGSFGLGCEFLLGQSIGR
jgi:hypothetical protein